MQCCFLIPKNYLILGSAYVRPLSHTYVIKYEPQYLALITEKL